MLLRKDALCQEIRKVQLLVAFSECSQTGRVGLFQHVCRNVTQSTTTTTTTTNTANAMTPSADKNKDAK